MSYRDIVVHIDNSEACSLRAAASVALAERYDARLHGYCVIRPEDPAIYGEGAIGLDLIQALLQRVHEDLTGAEAKFREAVADTDITTDCTVVKGQPRQLLARAARLADLTVVGQPDENDPGCASVGVAASVAFGAGSGVLVHPCKGEFRDVGKRVLVAWDGSREAQRAVNESLPFLRSAEHVEVISVITNKTTSQHGDQPAREICERLGRQGIEAHAHYVIAPDEAVGDTLLVRSADERVDLIVLGAYGHSRLRELLLGGVTRTVLREHQIPVLLAH